MSKKMYFLISFVLVLCLAGNVLAYDVMMWDNYEGAGDRLWTTSTNWYVEGSAPLERRAPISDDWVCIDFMADDANGPIINRGMDVTGGEWLGLGDYYPPIDVNEPVTLTMTGGRLTIGDWLSMGFYYEGIYRWDMSGGTIDLQGADGFTLGRGDLEEVGDGPYVTFNMSDGDFKCGAWLDIGAYNTAQADFNMTGGTFNVAMDLRIGAYEPNFVEWYTGGRVIKATGKGHLALHGGTMTVAGDLAIGGGFGEGTMDIANDGTLILQGDYRQANGLLFDPCSDDPNNIGAHSGTIAILADRGIITAYNTKVGEIITDGNYPSVVGKRAVINLDYDVPSAGWSTLTARALDPNLAWDPDPWDRTPDADSQAALTLSWAPGDYADTHVVYISSDRDAVINGTAPNTPTAANSIGAGDLEFGTAYYWRVDEVNGATTWPGDVWSFDVEGKARIVYPPDGAVEIPFLNLTLLWEAGTDAKGHDVYFGSDEAAVEDANINTTDVFQGNQPLADVNYALGDVDYGTTFYWRIDEVNTISGTFAKGHVWSFTAAPPRATNPSPKNGAGLVSPLVVLSWDPGPEADAHHVYFSSDLIDVLDRDPSVRTVRGPNNYSPGFIGLNTLYYWAVDEVNNSEEPNVWPGEVWDFKTDDHLHVDDFESYVNTGFLNDTWHDYVTTSGGTGQYNAEVVYEPETVYDGSSSMLYKYHNQDYPGFSESWAYAAELGAGTDWTVGGVKALRLYFYGDPSENSEADPVYDRMWVGLEDGSGTFALVNYDDMNDIKVAEWHEWAIRVQDFNDINNVDLTDVSKIYIGFGVKPEGEGGTEGEVYFDDIQLWPPWCRPELVETDFTGDCITDYEDVDVMARDWLQSDSEATAVPPSFPPMAWYKFDEGTGTTALDSSVHGNHGTLEGDPQWVVGYDGNALDFDGIDDYVDCNNNNNSLFDLTDNITVACWIKVTAFDKTWQAIVTKGDNTWRIHRWSTENGINWAHTGLSPLSISGSTNVNDGAWHHIAGTYDGTNRVLYVDGQMDAFDTPTGTVSTSSYPVYIGENAQSTGRYWNGLIDDVRIYDKSLTHGEIMYLAGVAGSIYVPVPSPANITDPEAKLSRKVNFRDYAIVADHWLEGPTLWP